MLPIYVIYIYKNLYIYTSSYCADLKQFSKIPEDIFRYLIQSFNLCVFECVCARLRVCECVLLVALCGVFVCACVRIRSNLTRQVFHQALLVCD